MLPLYPVLTARNHRKSAEKQKEHFTGEDYIAERPAAPALYLVFSYKEKIPATAITGTFYGGERTFYGGIGTFYGGIGTFYGGKIFFSTAEKASICNAFRAFRSRSKNPNILSIDNQLIIKPHSPPMPTAAAML